jgi:hypothetical protein
MSADEFQTVARVLSASALARVASAAVAALRRAWAQSHVERTLAAVRRQLSDARAEDRLRFAGVMLLAANATHAILVRIEPPIVRPAPLPLLRIEAALLALVLIVAAPQVAAAWRSSRARTLSRRDPWRAPRHASEPR